MIIYLLKSAGCLALLLFFYHAVLEKEKMHNFNRYYLLIGVFTSLTAPLITFVTYVKQPEITALYIPNTSILIEEGNFNYTQSAIIIYMLVTTVFFFRFGFNLIKIIKKINKNNKVKYQKATLVLVNDINLPHTFWNYIFINKKRYENGEIEQELFTHELTHAKQKHTFDVLLIEILQIVFWMNPLFIFLKKAIKLNHEFLADETVINTHKNTLQYQHLLLHKTAWNNNYYLASNLNYSLTKKRLKMMTTKSSHTKILLKKILVLPLLSGFIFLFAKRIEAQKPSQKENNIQFTLKKIDTLKKPITIKFENTSATKKELKEYNALLTKGKKTQSISTKELLKIQYLYKLMSKEQQSEVENFGNLIPPPPPPVAEKGHIVFKNTKLDKNNVAFFLNNKAISKKEIALISVDSIDSLNVKKDGNGNGAIYITQKNKIAYYVNDKSITKKEMEAIDPKTIKSVDVKKDKNGEGAVYIYLKKE